MKKPTSFIELRHAEHRAYSVAWKNFDLARRGGEAYARRCSTQHPGEDKEKYEFRMKNVSVWNKCPRVIGERLGYLTAQPPQINSGNPLVKAFIDKAMINGESLASGIHQMFDESMWDGTVVVAVDVPWTDTIIDTEQDAQDAGLVPFAYTMSPDNLLNWGRDESGEFEWALINQSAVSQKLSLENGIPKLSADENVSYILWTREFFYRLDKDGKEISSGANPFKDKDKKGIIPIVCIPYQRIKGNALGRPLLVDIEPLNRRVMWLTSLIDQICADQTFSTLVFQGEARGEQITGPDGRKTFGKAKIGTAAVLTYSEGANAPAYISPDAGQAAFLAQERQDTINEIYEDAELKRGSVEPSVQSGVAKYYDSRGTNSSLQKQAALMAEGIEKVLRIVAAYYKDYNDYPTVSFKSDFVTESAQEILNRLEQVDRITQVTGIVSMLAKKYVRAESPDLTEADLKELDDSIDAEIGGIPSREQKRDAIEQLSNLPRPDVTTPTGIAA